MDLNTQVQLTNILASPFTLSYLTANGLDENGAPIPNEDGSITYTQYNSGDTITVDITTAQNLVASGQGEIVTGG